MIGSFSGPYAFLSNFWPCRIEHDGLIYETVEAAFQAQKTLDLDQRVLFTTLGPGNAKRAGRTLLIREDWEQIKLSVMRQLLLTKFSDPSLRNMLLATGDEELVKGNSWGDVYWGVCNGVGENHLGRLLMALRSYCSLIEIARPGGTSQ
jgi:N-glycosidase YbiA